MAEVSNRILDEATVEFACEATDKEGVFSFVTARAQELGVTDDAKGLAADLFSREAEATTGLMEGFAIPHAKSPRVERPTVFYTRCADALPWETMDGSEVHHVFTLLVPAANAGDLHLEMLSKLAVALLDDDFKNDVKTITDKSAFVSRIERALSETDL